MIEIESEESWPFTIGSVSDDYETITCELMIDEPREIKVDVNKELLVVCSTETGIYRFPTRVTELDTDPMRLTLSLFKGAVHVQRREYFRLSRPLVLAKYRPVVAPEDLFTDEMKDAPIKDLSGNGVALIVPSNDEVEAGTPVRTELQLVSGKSVNLVGEVVRCIPNNPINGRSLMCIYFSLMEERDRDKLISQLFREQLTRAGKRRGLNRRST
jgi:c-di-GMP-binding flagellar brake protein YcgR